MLDYYRLGNKLGSDKYARQQFEEFLDGVNQEGPWAEYARAPMPAELAFEMFFVLLLENNYLGYVDWDAGGDEVLEACDRLFLRAGLTKFTDAEREEVARICTRCRQRGDPLLTLFDHLEAAAKKRAPGKLSASIWGKPTNSLRY